MHAYQNRVLKLTELAALAADYGFCVVGALSLASVATSWKPELAQGHADYAHILSLMPGAKSLVSFAFFYGGQSRIACAPGYGRVARYAWGQDYHKVLERQLQNLLVLIEHKLKSKLSYKIYTDATSLLEKKLAQAACLGSLGKNTLLITPCFGSFCFLAEILWEVEIEQDLNKPKVDLAHEDLCQGCSRCCVSCPNGALETAYVLDKHKCISYLSIEKKGVLSISEREALGEWVFGCDVCQEVCPHNAKTLEQSLPACLPDFRSEQGVGPLLNLEQVLKIRGEKDFTRVFGGTALTRARRAGLLRNAALVAANTKATALTDSLEEAMLADPSPIVRQHTLWAIFSLENKCNHIGKKKLRNILDKMLQDSDAGVRTEAQELSEIS